MRTRIFVFSGFAVTTLAGLYALGYSPLATREMLDLNEAVAAVERQFPDVVHIDTAAVKTLIDGAPHGSLQIVDVRDPSEFAVSHLPGAVNLPVSMTDTELLAAVKTGRPVIVYCSIGYRSSIVARRLHAAGRRNVSNFAGSIFAWANAGQPLESGRGTVMTVHPYNAHWGRYLRPEYRAF